MAYVIRCALCLFVLEKKPGRYSISHWSVQQAGGAGQYGRHIIQSLDPIGRCTVVLGFESFRFLRVILLPHPTTLAVTYSQAAP